MNYRFSYSWDLGTKVVIQMSDLKSGARDSYSVTVKNTGISYMNI